VKYYYYWIALLVFVVDQITKKIIDSQIMLNEKINVIGDFFVISHLRNPGAAFGILKNQTIFFILITLAVAVAIVWYIQQNRNSGKVLLLTALGMILGGAFGNFVDRALHGEVIDFLQFTFGTYEYPTFNVADMGITIGVILIIIDTLFDMKKGEADASEDGDKGHNGNEQHEERHEPIR
jgi:signal peptidase II